ncbi:hypothetical protein [Nocardiopsis sp. NRRL B-16309]|uniref:hypothetical protein n=1 Tax=Nocardiopsis sp. NRRL B-16309 TaxID=1519494 RepID=UPI0006AF1F41|nr:hypothetical protein [Nocardiopsis sp. NRRL B-16309]KOX10170.1 hypothetical protein ADL05_26215 [Nocardiopsis sp. NRRL B-16309]
MSTKTDITAIELSRAIAAHAPCCMYDMPGVTAAVVATLRDHGYPIADDIDENAFTAEERADLADRLESIAAMVRNTTR